MGGRERVGECLLAMRRRKCQPHQTGKGEAAPRPRTAYRSDWEQCPLLRLAMKTSWAKARGGGGGMGKEDGEATRRRGGTFMDLRQMGMFV